MAPYGERRSHVTTVEGVVMCPVLVDSVTLPAISAKRKDTLLRRAGAEQQHIDESCNKSPHREGTRQVQAIEQGTVLDPEVEELPCLEWVESHTSP